MDEPISNGWIIDPIAQAILFIGEEIMITGLLKRGLAHVENANPLLTLAKMSLLRLGNKKAASAIDRLLLESQFNQESAQKIRHNNYAILHTHSLVAIWGALESAVDNVLLALISNDPQSLNKLRESGVKHIDANMRASDLTEQECLTLYRKLKSATAVNFDIVQSMQNLLSAFNINIDCDRYKPNLLEANSVRNVIVHSFGVIDEKSVKNSPSLREYLGQPFTVSDERYLIYFDAIAQFLGDVQDKVLHSQYMKWKS